MSNEPIKRVSYTHDAMIDLIIAEPTLTQSQIGARFGYSRSWINVIMSSDAFKSRLAERRGEVVTPVLKASVEEQLEGLMRSSIQALETEMDKPNPDPNIAVKALGISSKALGFGQENSGGRGAPPTLEVLADNITMVFRKTKETIINGEATEIKEVPDGAETSDSE